MRTHHLALITAIALSNSLIAAPQHTLVVDTTNFNGKTWLNEGGEIVSYAEHVVERFTPSGPHTVQYEATVADPLVYTRPWTIAFPLKRDKAEMFETACHEEDRDLPRLKALKDAAAAKK